MFGGGARARVGKEAREGEKGENARGKESEGLARLFYIFYFTTTKTIRMDFVADGHGVEGREEEDERMMKKQKEENQRRHARTHFLLYGS